MIVSIGALSLLVLTAIYGHIGKGGCGGRNMDRPTMCPMMEMQRPCGNVELQRPPMEHGPNR